MDKLKGPPVGYVDILNVATEEYIREDAKRKQNPIRPSSAGACTRELAYKLMEFTGQAEYEKPFITPETHRVFSSGHALEYDLIKQFEKHCKDFFSVKYKQVPLDLFHFQEATRDDLKLWVEGSNDLCFIATEWRAVLDIKTKKDKFHTWSESDWNNTTDKLRKMKSVATLGETNTSFFIEDLEAFLEELSDPFFEANFLQLNCYAHADFMKKRGIDHCAIIQYNKNDQRLREIRFLPSEKLFLKVKKKFEDAIAAADKGDPELAPRDFMIGNIKCAFCDFKKHCWADASVEDPMKAWFKTLEPKFWARSVDMLQDEAVKQELYSALAAYEECEVAKKDLEKAEDRFVKAIVASGQRMVKFEKGKVFETRFLKGEGKVVLRRTKEK